MANALRKFWPTGVLFLIGLGFDLSPVRSDLVAYALWALAALWGLYASVPQIKRIRVGLKPPDAELREALGARDRWRDHFEAKQSEIQDLNEVRKHQLEKIREVEQEFQRLRDRNEQLDQLNKNLQVERDQLSDLLQDTKRENKKLRARPESAAREAGLPPNVATERRIAHCDFHINDLLRLAGRGFIIEGKDFVHCTMRGPGVISTFEDVRPPEQKPENTSLGTGYEPRTLTDVP